MLQPAEGSGAHAHPHGLPHQECGGEGWQWSPSVHHEKWCSTCAPCARCRLSLWVNFLIHSMIPVIVAVLTLSLFYLISSCSWYGWSYVTSPWTTLDIIQWAQLEWLRVFIWDVFNFRKKEVPLHVNNYIWEAKNSIYCSSDVTCLEKM